MSHGGQDWVSRINIFQQAIAEIVNRNKYGGFQKASVLLTASANSDLDYISISGRGYVFGSALVCFGSAPQHDDYAYAIIDGVRSDTPTFKQCLDWGLVIPTVGVPFVTNYDEVAYVYAMLWQGQLTFETSVKKGYHEASGNTPTVYEVLLYTLI